MLKSSSCDFIFGEQKKKRACSEYLYLKLTNFEIFQPILRGPITDTTVFSELFTVISLTDLY